MLKKILYISSFLLILPVFSQGKTLKEEYLSLLKEKKTVFQIKNSNLRREKIKSLAEKFISLGEKSKDTDIDIAVKCFENSAHLYGWGLGNAKKEFEILENLIEKYPEKVSYGAWLKVASLYWRLGWEKDEREQKLKKSIEIYRKLMEKYPQKRGEILKSMFEPYKRLGNKEEAIKLLDEAISFYQGKKETERIIAELYFKKSDIFFWGSVENCIEPLLKIIHDLNVDKDIKATAYFKIGRKYYVSRDFNMAIKNYEIVLRDYYKDIKNKRLLLDVYSGLGETYVVMGNIDEGIKTFLEGIEFGKKENIKGIEWLYLKIAQVYKNRKKDLEKAKKYLDEIKNLKEVHPAVLKQANKLLSEIE